VKPRVAIRNGLGLGLRAVPSLSVRAGGGGVADNVLFFNADTDRISKGVALSGSPKRLYSSFWVRLPDTSGGTPVAAVGWRHQDDLNSSIFGLSITYDAWAATPGWWLWFEVATAAGVQRRYYRIQLAGTNAQWAHFLIELDTTESVRANRFKLYVNDIKVAHSENDPDTDFNGVIEYSSTDNPRIDLEEWDSLAFPADGADSNVAAFWLRLQDGAALFDFDNAADRRNFIAQSGAYVTHAATMGGVAATIWGAGALSNWTGWTPTSVDGAFSSPVAMSPGQYDFSNADQSGLLVTGIF